MGNLPGDVVDPPPAQARGPAQTPRGPSPAADPRADRHAHRHQGGAPVLSALKVPGTPGMRWPTIVTWTSQHCRAALLSRPDGEENASPRRTGPWDNRVLSDRLRQFYRDDEPCDFRALLDERLSQPRGYRLGVFGCWVRSRLLPPEIRGDEHRGRWRVAAGRSGDSAAR